MSEKHVPAPQDIDTRVDTGELEAIYALDYEETDPVQAHEVRHASPTADRVAVAADRIAAFLDKRAVSRAHNAALEEYRQRDHADYVDHVASLAEDVDSAGNATEAALHGQKLLAKEHTRSDREERREQLLKSSKEHLQAIGYIALASGALGAEKIGSAAKATGETALGFGIQGYQAADARISNRLQALRFRRDMNQERRESRKADRTELKQFDREAKQRRRELKKEARQDIRLAKKDDRRFEREMREKMRSEKWTARIEKIDVAYQSTKQNVIVRVGKGIGRAGDAYRATEKRYDNAKQATINRVGNGIGHAGDAYRASKRTYESARDATIERKDKLTQATVKARRVGAAALAAAREERAKK